MTQNPTSTPSSVYTQGGSSTYQPGMQLNPSAPGISNTNWQSTAVRALAAKWASLQGDNAGRQAFLEDLNIPYTLVGTLNTTDGGVSPDGEFLSSPQTILALTRYAQNYQPGQSSYIDNTIPYVPPGPNEFIEDPVTVATRIAQFNTDRNYGLALQNATDARTYNQAQIDYQNRSLDIQKAMNAEDNAAATRRAQIQAQATTAAASIGADAQVEAARIGAQASIYGSQLGFKASTYGTQADIYGTQEQARGQAKSTAANLGLGLQGIYDERTNSIIKNLANPNDMVEREYATRALTGPVAEGVQGYQNFPGLSELYNNLVNYQPAPAPQAPSMSATGSMTTQPRTTVTRTRQPEGGSEAPRMAAGGMTMSKMFMTGDSPKPNPKADGARPEVIVNPTGAPVMVMTEQDMQKMHGMKMSDMMNMERHALGTQLGSYTFGNQTYSQTKPISTYTAPTTYVNSSGITIDKATGQPVQTTSTKTSFFSRPRTTTTQAPTPAPTTPPVQQNTTIPYGQDNPTNSTQPQVPTTSTTPTTPLSTPPVPQFQPPQVTLPSYQDPAYQNLPSLKYLSGEMPYSQWAGLATQPYSGPFNSQLPPAGAINMRKLLRLRTEDPDAYLALSSMYKAANRNLDVEASRAVQRAPVGQGMPLSAIMT